MLAIIYARQFHDPISALPYALLAYKYCNDEFYQRRGLRLIRTIKRAIKEEATARSTGPR